MLLVISQISLNSFFLRVSEKMFQVKIFFFNLSGERIVFLLPLGGKRKVELLQKPFVLFDIMCVLYSLKPQWKL